MTAVEQTISCDECGTTFARPADLATHLRNVDINGHCGPRHGIRATYTKGCRCAPCCDAASAARQRIRTGHTLVDDDGLPTLRFEPQPWITRAACRDEDPDIFFPGRGESTAPAEYICHGCPVRIECLEWALDHGEKHGIWGGLSERARRRIRTTRRQATT